MATLNLDTAANLEIIMRRGDTFSFEIDVALANGDPFDFSGCGAKFSVKENKDDVTSLVELTDSDGITLASGKITFNKIFVIDPAKYFHDFQITYPSTKVETWFTGNLLVRSDVGD